MDVTIKADNFDGSIKVTMKLSKGKLLALMAALQIYAQTHNSPVTDDMLTALERELDKANFGDLFSNKI